MTKCSTCGAVYALVQSDGLRYFHVCPALSDAEVCAALGVSTDAPTWSAKTRSDVTAASRVRPNARNENVPPAATLQPQLDAVSSADVQAYWKAVNRIRDTAIVAPGAGITVVADVQAAPVVGL